MVGEENRRTHEGMKAIDATDHIARLLKKVLDEDRHTGEINIKVICNQGGIRSMKIDVVDTRVSSFEFQGAEKKVLDTAPAT